MPNCIPMKKKTMLIMLFSILFHALHIEAQETIYSKEDSIFIEKILAKHPLSKYACRGERAVAIAKEFIGTDYVAGTLDRHYGEPLFVSTTELDCTTFVELVTAMAICNDDDASFKSVCRNIERLRYRNGIHCGYESRLHYISWWIDDSAKIGVIEEIHSDMHTGKQRLELCYMSRNSDKYAMLKNNPELVNRIAEFEKPYRGKSVSYIPEELTGTEKAKEVIKEGDIIAIATDVEGLDVTHVGIACLVEGELHMIHASSGKRAVVLDTVPLCLYLAKNKRHVGVRVFRIQ